MNIKKGKARLLSANASDLEEDSNDSDSSLPIMKSLQDFKERLGKSQQLYIRKAHEGDKLNCLNLEWK